jgi:hypothetical protein
LGEETAIGEAEWEDAGVARLEDGLALDELARRDVAEADAENARGVEDVVADTADTTFGDPPLAALKADEAAALTTEVCLRSVDVVLLDDCGISQLHSLQTEWYVAYS